MAEPPPCPLCDSHPWPEPIVTANGTFHHCLECQLIFRSPEEYLDIEAEQDFYLTHENIPDDPGYRQFLSRLADPLTRRLEPGSRGLDFGCGPGPALAAMLTARGFPTSIWDPLFATDPASLSQAWDFVTATEVIEHLHQPGKGLKQLAGLLRPGGYLGLMTEPRLAISRFPGWSYTRDPTHVAFYAPATMEWIAGWLNLEIEVMDHRVVIMKHPG